MKMNIYDHTAIIEIHSSGLIYRNENNEMTTIDFRECRRNWVEFVHASKEFLLSDLSEDKTVCVGWRDFYEKPPYIEFFTSPRTRFIFRFWWNRSRSFHNIQANLKEKGWSTYDLG